MRFQRECGHVDDGNTMMVHENDNDGCTMVQDDDDVHIISHDGGDDDEGYSLRFQKAWEGIHSS